ncbi:peptidoglycan-binding domain-containing protein [Streptomyces sp. NPDC046931]|uniref:peptidoglycan-binding domain-containing protein n=1 Tax=Streptomyces sp. NPDC046931 TaxID=3154806 RepID=UPI0033F8ACE7
MSTPPEQVQPVWRPVPEPTYVTRRRRTEALAELVRQLRDEDARPAEPAYEPIVVHVEPTPAEDATEELPPVPTAPGRPPRATRDRRERPVDDGLTLRRAALTVGVTAAALIGFGAALLLPGPGDDSAPGGPAAPQARPPATDTHTTPAASAPAQQQNTDPDGPGTLREGDHGPEVTQLQERLLRVPDVYRNGTTDGRYDATLAAAVARFQLWYGISGDETGVYGNDTRRSLESRTTL